MEVTIHDIAFGGKGVGRVEGKALFVPYTIAGERVRAEIVREKKQFAEAELSEVLEASPHRVQPPCPYFGRCGGCSYQHMAYSHQLKVKTHQVKEALRRLGRIEDAPMHAMIPSPKAYGYRRRITVHAHDGVVGYFRRDIHRLIDVKQCPIAAPEVNSALTELRARKPREGHFTLRSQAEPRIFTQTNAEVAETLATLVARMLPGPRKLLIDAYCGSGFFAKRLFRNFERVVGIEWDRFAIEAARADAGATETYISGDVEAALQQLLSDSEPAETSVIVDPPAIGLAPGIRRALLDYSPATVIYVSCDPATMARDLGELKTQFRLLSVTPLDMFPQTAEIECVVHLQNAKTNPHSASLPAPSILGAAFDGGR